MHVSVCACVCLCVQKMHEHFMNVTTFSIVYKMVYLYIVPVFGSANGEAVICVLSARLSTSN